MKITTSVSLNLFWLCAVLTTNGSVTNSPSPLIKTFHPPWERSSPRKIAENDQIRQVFSPEALELIKEYSPRANPFQGIAGSGNEIVYPYPYPNRNHHLTEEYRTAWEELYRESVFHGTNVANRMRGSDSMIFVFSETDGVVNTNLVNIGVGRKVMLFALSEINSVNSIPFLVDTYKKLQDLCTDENIVKQKEVLSILLGMNTKESFDAVFSLYDLYDKKFGNELLFQTRNKKMYESLFEEMLSYEFMGAAGMFRDERIKRAEQRRERLNTYQNPNLSEKSKMLLEAARRVGADESVRQ